MTGWKNLTTPRDVLQCMTTSDGVPTKGCIALSIMTNRLNAFARMLACALIGTTGLLRTAHHDAAQTAKGHPEAAVPACSHAAAQNSGHDSHDHDAPAGDADCVVCHLLAISATGVTADGPVRIVVAPPVDRRIPLSEAEPHSAEVDLPLSARAPPLA